MLWVILRLTFPLFSLLSVLIMLWAGFGAVFQSDVPQIAYESDPEGNWDIFLLDLNTHLTHNLTRRHVGVLEDLIGNHGNHPLALAAGVVPLVAQHR